MNADYTRLRPCLEALTEIIWILDGDTAAARISRSLDIAKVEYRHGIAGSSALKKTGTPDEKTSALSRRAASSFVTLVFRVSRFLGSSTGQALGTFTR